MLKLTGGVKVTQRDNFSGSISGVFERSSVKTAYEIQSLATTMFPLKINPEFDRKYLGISTDRGGGYSAQLLMLTIQKTSLPASYIILFFFRHIP